MYIFIIPCYISGVLKGDTLQNFNNYVCNKNMNFHPSLSKTEMADGSKKMVGKCDIVQH